MPIRDITGVNDGSHLFPDNTESTTNNNNSATTNFTSSEVITDRIQGYIGLLSAVYFDGVATSNEILIEDVDVWQEVVMTIHPNGVSDKRVDAQKDATPNGFSGTGAVGDPIVFLLEGLVEESAATLRTSLTFIPDEDGGRLDSRIFLERHSGATPSEDFLLTQQVYLWSQELTKSTHTL